jgi:hypothetical protein
VLHLQQLKVLLSLLVLLLTSSVIDNADKHVNAIVITTMRVGLPFRLLL